MAAHRVDVHMPLLAGCFALAVALSACVDDQVALDPGHGVIFPAEKAASLAHQCSRSSPGPIDSTWTPVESQISELEAQLPREFVVQAARASWKGLHVADYYRQYAGMVIGGRQIIYVNAFVGSMPPNAKSVEDASKLPPGPLRSRLERDWHTSPVGICDGGAGAFGVEYFPDSKAFADFEFNYCMCVRYPKS
jgi:hypothetical protein